MASIAYDVALIFLQARTPADEIFGKDSDLACNPFHGRIGIDVDPDKVSAVCTEIFKCRLRAVQTAAAGGSREILFFVTTSTLPSGRSATNIASRWRMASIAYDVALILPQARIPADGIFGNDSGFEPSHQEFVSVVPCDRWQIVHAPAAGSGADLLALSPHRTIAVAIGHNDAEAVGQVPLAE